jgi:hypothetical protein
MDDEFLTYLQAKVGERLISSFESIDLLLWGMRRTNDVNVLGLTLAVGVGKLAGITSDGLNELAKKSDVVLRKALLLAQRSGIPLFTVFYSLSGESLFRITETREPLNFSASMVVEENQMPGAIQSRFGTKSARVGTTKEVNKSTSDWFHVWARANLPTEYVKANVDGLVLTDIGGPSVLLETKRSFVRPASWNPYPQDSRNYYLQNALSKKTGMAFWTVYHKKGITVEDNSEVSLFVILDVNLSSGNWISYRRYDISASEVVNMLQTG